MAIRRGFMASGISRTSSILQQPVVERGVLDLDVVGQVELPLEVPGRDTAVQELALGLFRLVAFDRHDVLLGRDRNFVGREAGYRQRDLVAVFAQPFDVVGRIVVLGQRAGRDSARSKRRSKPMVERQRGEKS